MSQPLITFITPVYNTEKYLNDCVQSVLSQSDPNWELILIDDGSTDRCRDICDKYSAYDSRIRVIHGENEGQYKARIKGIKEANGKYCTGLDSDDFIEERFVKTVSELLTQYDSDIVTWNLRIVKDGKEVGIEGIDRYGEYTCEEFLKYVSRSTDHSFCDKLIRTSLLVNSEFGSIPPGLRHSEDYIMICPSLCMSTRIIAIDETLYNYRQQDDSVTHSYSSKRVLDYLDSTECILNIYSDYSKLTPELNDLEFESLISAVGFGLKQAYKTGKVLNEEIKAIRNHHIYKQLSKYENTKYITKDLVIVMKLFRFRIYRLISWFYGKKNG